MRCRKVRSCLSAYCSDELSSSRKLSISEHLATCSECRREEAVFRTMAEASPQLSGLTVADDFNNKLLNRVARERFAETRTRAYLPRRAPLILWQRAIPAAASVCVAVLLVVIAFSPQNGSQNDMIANQMIDLNDSYLTVQPQGQASRAVNVRKSWSLSDQLAQAERLNRISRAIMRQAGWSDLGHSYAVVEASSHSLKPIPSTANYYRVRPVVQTYMSPQSPSGKEVYQAY